jgi:hypothetical protein
MAMTLCSRRWRRPTAVVISAIVFVLNPGFGCSGDDGNNFAYGESEMTAAVHGTWRLSLTRPDGDATVTFTLAPGPGAPTIPPGMSPLCGNRDFVRPAGACITTSTLHLVGQIVAAEPPIDGVSVTGTYLILGFIYHGGELAVRFDNALAFSAELDANGLVTATYTDANGARVPSTLERVP